MNFNLIKKRDVFLSLLCGLLSGFFLILIVKNPYIEELKDLTEKIGELVWLLPLVSSIIFLFGIVAARILFKSLESLFQFAKFVEAGVLNTFIDVGIYNGLMWFSGVVSGPLIIPLNVFSFSCAVGNSYFWNKFWTFEKKDKAKRKEFFQFFVVTMIGMGINTSIVYLGTTLIPQMADFSVGAWANLVKIGATFISMIWNFLGYKFIVFKR